MGSISSNITTPPPTLSNRSYLFPSHQESTLIYHPKAIKTAPKSYNWTPICSAITSPASSVASVTDQEVEFTFMNSSSYNPPIGITPSPSPLRLINENPQVADDTGTFDFESLASFAPELGFGPSVDQTPAFNPLIDSTIKPQVPDDIDAFIFESLSSLGAGPDTRGSELNRTIPESKSGSTAGPWPSFSPDRQILKITRKKIPNRKPGARVEHLYKPQSQKNKSTNSMTDKQYPEETGDTAREEIPNRKPSARVEHLDEPQTQNNKSTNSVAGKQCPEETGDSAPPTTLTNTPLVSFEMNQEGVPVFTILPIQKRKPKPKPAHVPAIIRKLSGKVIVNDRFSRVNQTATSPLKKAPTEVKKAVRKTQSKRNQKEFCISNIVKKFMQPTR